MELNSALHTTAEITVGAAVGHLFSDQIVGAPTGVG